MADNKDMDCATLEVTEIKSSVERPSEDWLPTLRHVGQHLTFMRSILPQSRVIDVLDINNIGSVSRVLVFRGMSFEDLSQSLEFECGGWVLICQGTDGFFEIGGQDDTDSMVDMVLTQQVNQLFMFHSNTIGHGHDAEQAGETTNTNPGDIEEEVVQ